MVFKFVIDDYVNKYIPHNRLDKLPKLLGRFLGQHNATPKSDLLIWTDIFITTFCGIALVEGIFKSHTIFTNHHVPVMLASYGATSILCFNTINQPSAQPRNIFFGHFIGSLIGVCIQKLFSLSEGGRDNYWVSGALSVAITSVLMSILNCTHPPGGASAILPSINEGVRAMSWWFLLAQIVDSLLIIGVSLICNNIIRKYPQYWWTPVDLVHKRVDDKDIQSITTPFDPIILNKEVNSEMKESLRFSSNDISFEIYYDEITIPDDVVLKKEDMDWLISLQKILQERKQRVDVA